MLASGKATCEKMFWLSGYTSGASCYFYFKPTLPEQIKKVQNMLALELLYNTFKTAEEREDL